MARMRNSGAMPGMPSKKEMLRMDAEMMAKRHVDEMPAVKKMIAQKAREILRAVNGGRKAR